MPERPRPDLSRVRDAMRDHDEREESEAEPVEEPEETPPEDDGDA